MLSDWHLIYFIDSSILLSVSSVFCAFFLFKKMFSWLSSLIVVHYERCAEKLAYKRQKEKEKEREQEKGHAAVKEIELQGSAKRKRYYLNPDRPLLFLLPYFWHGCLNHRGHEESDDTSEDESTEKNNRKRKGIDCIYLFLGAADC